MKFTKNKPTEPGFYWVKMYPFDITIVQVTKSHLSLDPYQELYVYFVGDECKEKLSLIDDMLWGNKIEQPVIE